MSRALRLLMSARDPGAVPHVVEIARRAAARENIEVTLVAMPPATDELRKAGLAPHGLDLITARDRADPASDRLLGMARDWVRRSAADAVLVGLSGPDAGIDEALLVVGPSGQRYAVQDYWGDVNLSLEQAPDCLFVAADAATAITRSRLRARTVVAGTPKYARLDKLDVPSLRRDGRAALGADDDRQVLGIFLQPLWGLPGYAAQWETVVGAAAGLAEPPLVLVRRHPKDETAFPVGLGAKIAAAGLSWSDGRFLPLDSALAACDLVCSAYSTVGEDYLNMLRVSPVPLGSVLYVMTAEVNAHFRAASGLEAPPPSLLGLARVCAVDVGAGAGVAAIEAELASALSPSVRTETWRAARVAYRDQGGAADRILDEICAGVSAAASPRDSACRSRA